VAPRISAATGALNKKPAAQDATGDVFWKTLRFFKGDDA